MSAGILQTVNDSIVFSYDYRYANGPLTIISSIPGGGNLSLESYGPTGSIVAAAPAIGSTSGNITWIFPDRTSMAGDAAGTVWVKCKLVNPLPAGTAFSTLATGRMTGLSDIVVDFPASVDAFPLTINVAQSRLSGSLGDVVTYVMDYLAEGGVLKAFRPFDDITPGVYSASPPAGWKFDPFNGENGTWTVSEPCNTGDRFITADIAGSLKYPALLLDNADTSLVQIRNSAMVEADVLINPNGDISSDLSVLIKSNGLAAPNKRYYALTLSIDNAPAGYISIEKSDGTPAWYALDTVNSAGLTGGKWFKTKTVIAPSAGNYIFNVKVWKRGDPEPNNWMTWTDTGAAADPDFMYGGNYSDWRPGIFFKRNISATNSFDNFILTTSRPFTGIEVYDTVPAGITYAGAMTPPSSTGPVLKWSLGDSSEAVEGSLTWWGIVNACVNITNVASIKANTPGGITADSNGVVMLTGCGTIVPTPTLTPVMPTAVNTATNTVTRTYTATMTPTIAATCLIDDCNDGDDVNYLGGAWRSYDDSAPVNYGISYVWPPTSGFIMSAPGYGGTGYAAGITGTVTRGTQPADFKYPLIGMECMLTNVTGTSRDLSGASGISFRVKRGITDTVGTYKVMLMDSLNPDPTTMDYFSYLIGPAQTPAGTWVKISIPFSMMNLTYGSLRNKAQCLSQLYAIAFQSRNPDPNLGQTYVSDFMVDDIEIYGLDPCPPVNTPAPLSPTFSPTITATMTLTPTITQTQSSFFPDDTVITGGPGDDTSKKVCKDASGNIYTLNIIWDDTCTCYVIYIYKYLPDGSIDLTFGENGKIKCPGPMTNYVWNNDITMECDPSGKLVVAGCAGSDLCIYRFNADGSCDTTFNGCGWKVYANAAWTGPSYGCGISFDSSGKIVCTGKAWNGTDYDSIIIKCNDDGSLDTSFGTGGCVKSNNAAGGNGDDCGTSIVCSGGKIYVTGYSASNDPGCSGTCRAIVTWCYLEDGTPVNTFGGDGTCCRKYISTVINHKNCIPVKIAITVGGKIVITGSVDDGSGCDLTCQQMIVIVMNADGSYDTTFNGTGVVTSTGGGSGACGKDAFCDASGNIWVCGTRHNGANKDICVWKYLPDGTADTTFGIGGCRYYDSGNDEEGTSILNLTVCRAIASGRSYVPSKQYDMILWNIEDLCPPHTVTATTTATFTYTPSKTVSPTATMTATQTRTMTATNTATPSVTSTVTLTQTNSATQTRTSTPTPTLSLTCACAVSFTFTPTKTITATLTHTVSATPTFTATPTRTSTKPATPTATATSTQPCTSATPGFSVHLVYNPEHLDYVVMEITSTHPLVTPPSLTIYAHGNTDNKPVLSGTAFAVPGDTTGMFFRYLYSKQTGWGDIDRVAVTGADACGNAGTSSGAYTKETISEKDVTLYKSVINPEKGERSRIVFNAYENDNATVKIYSRTGALIKTLFDGPVSARTQHEVIWDGTNDKGQKVVSGTYIVSVETDYYKSTQKIAVVH